MFLYCFCEECFLILTFCGIQFGFLMFVFAWTLFCAVVSSEGGVVTVANTEGTDTKGGECVWREK